MPSTSADAEIFQSGIAHLSRIKQIAPVEEQGLSHHSLEFREVAGPWRSEAELASKAQALRAQLSIKALLITRSEEGMSLYTDDGARHIPAQAREVFDVSGAGDTVIATLGTLLGARADLDSAVHIANQAAGIVVGKLGTAVVSPNELD